MAGLECLYAEPHCHADSVAMIEIEPTVHLLAVIDNFSLGALEILIQLIMSINQFVNLCTFNLVHASTPQVMLRWRRQFTPTQHNGSVMSVVHIITQCILYFSDEVVKIQHL